MWLRWESECWWRLLSYGTWCRVSEEVCQNPWPQILRLHKHCWLSKIHKEWVVLRIIESNIGPHTCHLYTHLTGRLGTILGNSSNHEKYSIKFIRAVILSGLNITHPCHFQCCLTPHLGADKDVLWLPRSTIWWRQPASSTNRLTEWLWLWAIPWLPFFIEDPEEMASDREIYKAPDGSVIRTTPS
jgi:hypothetical protein